MSSTSTATATIAADLLNQVLLRAKYKKKKQKNGPVVNNL